MYPWIICYTCGNDVGSLYEAYNLAVHKRLKAYHKEKNITVLPDFNFLTTSVPTGDILDKLGLRRECCRRCMLTCTWFKDYY